MLDFNNRFIVKRMPFGIIYTTTRQFDKLCRIDECEEVGTFNVDFVAGSDEVAAVDLALPQIGEAA